MIRLAFIGQATTAEAYGNIRTQLHRASWTAFVPIDIADRQNTRPLGQVVTVFSPEVLFKKHTNDFDAVIIDAASAQAENLINAAATAGKPTLASPLLANPSTLSPASPLFMPAHAWRFLPSIQVIKRSLDSGKLGEPGLLRIHRWLPHTASPQTLAERILPDTDLTCWMFDGEPEKIWTLQSSDNPNYIQFHLGYANDRMAMIDITSSLPADSNYFSLSIIGGAGAAYADDHHNMNLIYTGGPPNALLINQGRADLAGQLQEFVDAIHQKRPAAVTLDDATRANSVAKQIIASAELNQVIERKENN